MAVPTITSISSALGAADGQTLVEIRGSGFSPPPAGNVRVTIGGRRATHVLVYADDELTCLTPPGDPDDYVISGVFAASVFTAAGHQIKEGARLRFDAGAPSPLRRPEDPQAVALYAVNVVPGVSLQVAATPAGAPIFVVDGPATVRTELYADVTVQNLDATGAPVIGETATLTAGFSFRRPDLARDGALVRLEQAIVRDLKRIHTNVAISTNVDYDAQTGDVTFIQPISGFPALVLSNPRKRENRSRTLSGNTTQLVGDESRFIERRARKIYDALYLLIAVSDNHSEALNLHEALDNHFQKTGRLAVRRTPESGPDDEVEYDYNAQFLESTIDVQGGGSSGVEAVALGVVVTGAFEEASEGMPSEGVPGAPVDVHHEATRAFGYTLDVPEILVAVTFEPKL